MSSHSSRVFISYQRADETFARQVREHLTARGVKTWMDQYDIPVGAYWPDEIDGGLSSSDIVVGILSPDAIESRNVKNEWDWAIQNGKRLLLMHVSPCLIPHRYISINFIDATAADASPALAALLRSIGVDTPASANGLPTTSDAAPLVPIRHSAHALRPMSRVPPFIAGREREQALLRGQLDKLLAGSGSLVLVGGEAGIGKTTLTHWLAAEAEARGAVVLAGGCYDLTTTPPYGPWGGIIRGWPEERGLPPVPEALRGGEAMARLQSQAALFELATDLLATAGTVRPIVLLLEDLHWADQPSLDLLHYLARLVAGFRIMLVATYRDDEITRRHPLFALIPALAREAGAERVSLQRLGPEAVRDLIASRYAIADDERARLAGYVQRVTEGNPFFAGEVLRALEESRAIEQGDAGWRLGDLDRVQVPDLVRQVIEGRLAHLGEDVHRQLQVAAVIGHEVPVDVWIAVSGEDEGRLSDALDRATEARILEELRGGDGFRFTHALIRETLYEGLGLLRRRALHRRAGEALVEAGRPDPDTVAHHFSQASDPRVFVWLIQAGDRAKRSYAWLIAAERYEQAAAVVADDPERAREYGWLLVGIAQMLRYADAPRAVRYMDEAAKVGEAVGDVWLALSSAIDAGYYRIHTERVREGVDRMVEVGHEMEVAFRDGRLDSWSPLAFVKDFPRPVIDYTLRKAAEWPDRAVVLTRSIAALHLANTGRFREAQELTGQLAVVWPPDLEDSHGVSLDGNWRNAFGDLYMAHVFTEHALGLPQRALQSVQVALREYTAIPHHFLIALSHARILRTLITYRTEEVERRRTAANDAVEAQTKAQGAMQSGSPPNLHRAPLWIVEGAWVDAYAMLHAYLFPRDGSYQMPISVHIAMPELATICVYQGRREEALDLIRRMMPGGADTEPGDHAFYPALVLLDVAASLALDIGDLTTAHAWLVTRDRWMVWSGAVLGQVEGHLGWARYHRQAGDLDAAEAQARTALEKASNPRQPLGLIASHRLLGELATERGNHNSAQIHLSESLALADACATPFERALTLVAQAELAIATGADAREMLSEARAICERLGAEPTLKRIAVLEKRLAGA